MKHDIAFFEDTHEYIVDGVPTPSVTEILQPLTNRGYSNVNPSVLDYARRRGTAVHEALEAIDLDLDPDVSPEILPYIRAYEEWTSIYRPSWTGIEQIVYHEYLSDGDWKIPAVEFDVDYIGTLDRIGYLNGTELAIVDIKTSQPTKEALVSVCCQTAAYAQAVYDFDKPERYGLFLKNDGTFRFVNCKDYEVKYAFSGSEVFFSLLENHRMITKLLATGKGKNGLQH